MLANLKTTTKTVGTVISLLTLIAQYPGVADAIKVLIAAHPHSVFGGIGLALLSTLLHRPTK